VAAPLAGPPDWNALRSQVSGGLLRRGEAGLEHSAGRQQAAHRALAAEARTLIRRFIRYEDTILRFATDLSAPFSHNVAERSVRRPVKVQQRTSGGSWRALKGLTNFAVVHSYLDTATTWGTDKLLALQQLFTTGPCLPPCLTPAE
jgi:transposase